MTNPSAFVSLSTDGTGVLEDGRVVRLVAGRNGILGHRDVDLGGTTMVDTTGIDQLGKTPVPTMREALSG